MENEDWTESRARELLENSPKQVRLQHAAHVLGNARCERVISKRQRVELCRELTNLAERVRRLAVVTQSIAPAGLRPPPGYCLVCSAVVPCYRGRSQLRGSTMSLVGSATIRKIAQSFSVCAALLGAVAPDVAFAQSEVRRPVRQVETEDGVIEITNSDEAVAHPSPEETTSVRASSAVDRRGERQAKSAHEPSAPDPPTGAAQSSTAASSTWWLPLIVVAIAGATCVWGVRRRNSSRASSKAGASGSDVPGRIEALNEASDLRADAALEPDVVDEPAPFVAPFGQLAAPPGPWVDAVRDSVPPSSPPRSSRGANAPRQWVSQPLRIKSDES